MYVFVWCCSHFHLDIYTKYTHLPQARRMLKSCCCFVAHKRTCCLSSLLFAIRIGGLFAKPIDKIDTPRKRESENAKERQRFCCFGCCCHRRTSFTRNHLDRNVKWIISIWCFPNFSTSHKQVRLSACMRLHVCVWVLTMLGHIGRYSNGMSRQHTCANNKQHYVFCAFAAINHFY